MSPLPKQIVIRPEEMYSIERLCGMFERTSVDHFRRQNFRKMDDPDDGRVPMVKFAGAWMVLGSWLIDGICKNESLSDMADKG